MKMGEARNRRGNDYEWCGKDGEQFDEIIAHVLEGSNDRQVVIGPLVKPPLGDNRTNGRDYFTIASSEPGRGFRCDQIIIGDGLGDGVEHRNGVLAAFVRFGIGRELVVHDTDDGFIWPSFAKLSGQAIASPKSERPSRRSALPLN